MIIYFSLLKGENVSTAEVEAVIQKVTKLSDCVVFGVNVNGCEGKAGMAVIAGMDNGSTTLDMTQLARELYRLLPPYAVPVFIRLTNRIEVTGTYKLLKNDLAKIGYSIHLTFDPIYYLDSKLKDYIAIDERIYQDIENGAIKF